MPYTEGGEGRGEKSSFGCVSSADALNTNARETVSVLEKGGRGLHGGQLCTYRTALDLFANAKTHEPIRGSGVFLCPMLFKLS